MAARSDPGPILLLGGRSEIGLAVVERLVGTVPRHVILAARPGTDLEVHSSAVLAAGALTVTTVAFDADDLGGHRPLLDEVVAKHGPVGTAIVAFGILGDQARAEHDVAHALAIVHTDLVAQVSILGHLAALARAAGSGEIVAFSSVAGARVRRANYVYGAAKAGLDGYATGLSTALVGSGANLLVVRPGFVVGRMTAGLAPAPLSSTPGQVADATVAALAAGRASVWVPAALGPLATLAHLVPGRLWARLPR